MHKLQCIYDAPHVQRRKKCILRTNTVIPRGACLCSSSPIDRIIGQWDFFFSYWDCIPKAHTEIWMTFRLCLCTWIVRVSNFPIVQFFFCFFFADRIENGERERKRFIGRKVSERDRECGRRQWGACGTGPSCSCFSVFVCMFCFDFVHGSHNNVSHVTQCTLNLFIYLC